MKKEIVWKNYSDTDISKVNAFAESYRRALSDNKTEREWCDFAVAQAKGAGFKSLAKCIKKHAKEGATLKAGDKIWATRSGKLGVFVQIGRAGLSQGMNIVGAHIDSPRLDLKQNPVFEKDGFCLLDTHYYGGIKKYQWVTIPLAIHGVVAKKDGEVVNICVGEDENDPVFCVSDLLVHLAQDQMEKVASKVIDGEALDIIVGNQVAACQAKNETGFKLGKKESEKDDKDGAKDPVKAFVLDILQKKYGFEEDDFLSAELEVVPAGPARDMGFDRSMILGYGHDDRVCAYPSLRAVLDVAQSGKIPEKTTVCLLVDKEEIGSKGATSMSSAFFENVVAEIYELLDDDLKMENSDKGTSVCGCADDCGCKCGAVSAELAVRRAIAASNMLSSDVNGAIDPGYESCFEEKNASNLGCGMVFTKFTGSRGKSGSNDADAEYIAKLRKIMDDAGVNYYFSELGKVDVGGGGTIAFILANLGMNVIDCGVPLLSMHAPWEVASKADIYEAYKSYVAFLQNA